MIKTSKYCLIAISLTLVIGTLLAIDTTHRLTAKSMAEAANRFIASLSTEQQKEAVSDFKDARRVAWNFLPDRSLRDKRFGIPLKSLSSEQRMKVKVFLKTGLSHTGYLKVEAIRNLETILRNITGQAHRDSELYYFSIFGTPSNKGTWGWRMEGHHLSLNYTIVDGKMIATAPRFFGANPAEVREGPDKGLRVLHAEEDIARKLFDLLDNKQQSVALFREEVFKEIVTKNLPKVDPLKPVGISGADLNEKQRELLLKLIHEYADAMPTDLAAERLEKIRNAGIEKIHFGWAGSTERGKKHYYRIQGSSFLIEFCNRQSNGNHIHAVWRDFNGDFGRDILQEHLLRHH